MSDKQTILIVDDTPVNILVLKGMLLEDYSVLEADSGEAALELLEHIRPDLILLDIMMPPGIDGYEVCRIVKSRQDIAAIPIIFVSALARTEDESHGFAVGAVDYITKPVKVDLVRARVKTYLALADQQRATEKQVRDRTYELEQNQRAAIQMLGEAGHYNDTDTGVHIWRMAAISAALARALNWSVEDVEVLELAASMHDTGKIGIPDSILKATGKFTAEQWEIMKTHAEIGHQILSKCNTPVFQMAAQVAYCHHEKWDGSGYPRGLSGKEIPEVARIVAIGDVFDALTMARIYKDAWTTEDAIAQLEKGSGQHFDPAMIDVFLSIMPEILEIKTHWDAQGIPD